MLRLKYSFNLHFQEPPFLTRGGIIWVGLMNISFQSPFSGASLSYVSPRHPAPYVNSNTFNLHFQEPPFLTYFCVGDENEGVGNFQSPFSGASLSYTQYGTRLPAASVAFNLHFQEPPFLTQWENRGRRSWTHLSISIFRSLPFLRIKLNVFDIDLVIFQSPFSGASLSYSSNGLLDEFLAWIFQSPFSGASLSYEIFRTDFQNCKFLSISIFRSLPFLLTGI